MGQSADWAFRLEALRKTLQRYAMHHLHDEAEAAELAQEVIFRCVRGSPREDEPLLPYASKILRNLLLRRWRDSGRTRRLEDLSDPDGEGARPGDESAELGRPDQGLRSLEDHEVLELIRWRTARFPRGLREVCEQHWFQHKGYGEIATTLGIDEVTARVRCFKGRLLLSRESGVHGGGGWD